ncbi:MAG TPA: MFS transporter, partial [Lentisphaeria bacterium]|nr:MFS transporter [Lentisphaeria bacterium]
MNKPSTASGTSVLHSMGFKAFLATQFLGAFNDNVFKLLIICSAMNYLSPEASKSYVPLASGVFILPYLLFSGYAGYLADRFSKRQVMIGTKWLEVVVMLLGWWLFWQGAIYWLLPVLFLMGAQSAFFSPAKYGFLPEVLPEKHLPRGNGATQLFTFLAIIFGGWAGGELSERFKDALQNAAVFCVLVAVLGVVTSYGITKTPPGNRSTRCDIDPLTPHLRTLLEV